MDLAAIGKGAYCPAPQRVAHSHWMCHIPFAFWLVEQLKPNLLVELGTYQGASFCAFCQQLKALNLDCPAFAIDSWQGDQHMGHYAEAVYAELQEYVKKNYSSFATLLRLDFDAALSHFKDGDIDLLHIDGAHDRKSMLHDFETWLPKMSDRGVILIHDVATRLPGYGGIEAWEEIRTRFPSFAFRHGYGLGVILAGTKAPQILQAIAALNQSEKEDFYHIFQQQAALYQRLFDVEEQRQQEAMAAENREKALSAQLGQVGEQAATLEKELARLGRLLGDERLVHAQEGQKWQEALAREALRSQALEGSLSWKLTAPLRKLARFWRK